MRDRAFNSVADVSDTEGTQTRMRRKRARKALARESSQDLQGHSDALLEQVCSAMMKRAQSQDEYNRANLRLAEDRLRREALEQQERERVAKAQLDIAHRKLLLEERAQALELLKHPNPQVQEAGLRLLAQARVDDE